LTELTLSQIMTLSLKPLIKSVRRWLIKLEMADLQYHIAHIRSVRANDFEVERISHARHLNLKLELRDLEGR